MGNIKYRYIRPHGGYPGPGELANGLTRHHIFSYPFMLTYAVATLHYLNISNDTAAIDKLRAFYQARRGAAMPNIGDFRNDTLELEVERNMGSLVWICWAEPNLFIGPSGVYRADDPSQKQERFPLGLPEKQKKLAEAVRQNWNAVSSSRVVGEDGETISVSLNDTNMKRFVYSFLEYITFSEGQQPQRIYRTKYSDWVVKQESGTSKAVYHFVMSRGVQKEENVKFQFLLREGNMKPAKEGVSLGSYADKFVWGRFRGTITQEEMDATF